MNFLEAMNIVERGFDTWKDKPHNAKWYRRIDGTPIPNDLKVNIAEAICQSLSSPPAAQTVRDALERIAQCSVAGYSLNGKESHSDFAEIISHINNELQTRVKIAAAILAADSGKERM